MSPARISTRSSPDATSRAVSAMRSSTSAMTCRSACWSSSARTSRRPMKPGKPVTRAVATSDALEDHERDLAVGLLLVLVVVRPDLGQGRPQTLALLALGVAMARAEAVALDLDADPVLRLHVEVPGGMLGGAALGRDDDGVAVDLAVDQGHDPLLAGLAPGRGQQQD